MASFAAFIVAAALYSSILFTAYLIWARKKRQQATNDIVGLSDAICAFMKKYGRNPIVDSSSDEQPGRIMLVLSGAKWDFGPHNEYVPPSLRAQSADAVKLNPELVNFCSQFKDRRYAVDAMLADPWGNPYHISFDIDGDGVTQLQRRTQREETVKYVEAPFVIWSSGPNGKNELGEGDDIVSWRIS